MLGGFFASEAEAYTAFVVAWWILGVVIVIALQYIDAPYGKFGSSSWGPVFPDDRWGWVVMELPPHSMVLWYILGSNKGVVEKVILGLFMFHYIYRTFIYPFLMVRREPKPMPVIIAASGAFFNIINAYIIGRHIFTLGPGYTTDWFYDPRFIVGTVVFFVGWAINQQADYTLRQLRVTNPNEYSIPRGGIYNYVSAGNYFGEMVEWLGFGILTWDIGAFSFAALTASNVYPRGVATHKYYLKKFDDYPKDRKAVIPFIH